LVRAQEEELSHNKLSQKCGGFFVSVMGYCVYILHSAILSRFYTGYTSNFEIRAAFHSNADLRKFTYRADDWMLFLRIDCDSKEQAIAIEKHIKRMKSSVYIRNLNKYPEIVERLLKKYNQ